MYKLDALQFEKASYVDGSDQMEAREFPLCNIM